MISKAILKRLKAQIGIENTEVSEEEVKLASTVALLAEQEALGRIVALCGKQIGRAHV